MKGLLSLSAQPLKLLENPLARLVHDLERSEGFLEAVFEEPRHRLLAEAVNLRMRTLEIPEGRSLRELAPLSIVVPFSQTTAPVVRKGLRLLVEKSESAKFSCWLCSLEQAIMVVSRPGPRPYFSERKAIS